MEYPTYNSDADLEYGSDLGDFTNKYTDNTFYNGDHGSYNLSPIMVETMEAVRKFMAYFSSVGSSGSVVGNVEVREYLKNAKDLASVVYASAARYDYLGHKIVGTSTEEDIVEDLANFRDSDEDMADYMYGEKALDCFKGMFERVDKKRKGKGKGKRSKKGARKNKGVSKTETIPDTVVATAPVEDVVVEQKKSVGTKVVDLFQGFFDKVDEVMYKDVHVGEDLVEVQDAVNSEEDSEVEFSYGRSTFHTYTALKHDIKVVKKAIKRGGNYFAKPVVKRNGPLFVFEKDVPKVKKVGKAVKSRGLFSWE